MGCFFENVSDLKLNMNSQEIAVFSSDKRSAAQAFLKNIACATVEKNNAI